MARPLSIVLMALSLVGLTGPVTASGGLTEAIDVALVAVDLYVADDSGQPVTDLEAHELELRLDGKPVELASFEPRWSVAEGVRFETHLASGPQAGRVAVFVDTAFMGPGDLDAALPHLRLVLETGLSAGTHLMLAVADPELEIRQTFTSAPEEILAKLEELPLAHQPSRSALEYDQILRDFEMVIGHGSPKQPPRVPAALPEALLTRIGDFAAQTQAEVGAAAQRLARLVAALRGLPSQREILYVTGRPPAAAGNRLMSAWRDTFGQNPNLDRVLGERGDSPARTDGEAQTGGVLDFSSFGALATAVTDLDFGTSLWRVAQQAAVAAIPIHTLDVGGGTPRVSLVASKTGGQLGPGGSESAFIQRLGIDEGLSDQRLLAQLAHLSGGRWLSTRSDVGPGLSQILSGEGPNYSLAFAPPAVADRELHEIDVRVLRRRAKLSLSHRRYYRFRDPDERVAEQALSALLIDELDNHLAVTLEVEPGSDPTSSEHRIPLSVSLPLTRIALQPEGRYHLGQLSVFAVAGGSLQDHGVPQKIVLPISISNQDLLTSLGRPVQFSLQIVAPTLANRVAVSVRDDLANLVSTAVAEIVVTEEP